MGTDNYNNNPAVASDDDTTSELQILSPRLAKMAGHIPLLELDADTVTLLARPATPVDGAASIVNRLETRIEHLRSQLRAQQVENSAREKLIQRLNSDAGTLSDKIARKDKLLAKRKTFIRGLKAEIRKRADDFQQSMAGHEGLRSDVQSLQVKLAKSEAQLSSTQQWYERTEAELTERNFQIEALNRQSEDTREASNPDPTSSTIQERLAEQAGRLVSRDAEVRELRDQVNRTEAYSDELRRQLQIFHVETDEQRYRLDNLQLQFGDATRKYDVTAKELAQVRLDKTELEKRLADIHQEHENELRLLRFEMSEAQETIAQSEMISEQLASDLIDTRSFRDQLEHMLAETEGEKNARIEALESDVRDLRAQAAELRDKLAAKKETINCLLAELARESEPVNGDIEVQMPDQDADQDNLAVVATHARAPLNAAVAGAVRTPGDRISRVLIGTIGQQELRFPLFKDRLTIGRTRQNDIQLMSPHISRRHAVIVTDGDTTRLVDWGSKNGVYVNSERVTEHFLANGDKLTIGTAAFRYEERAKRDA